MAIHSSRQNQRRPGIPPSTSLTLFIIPGIPEISPRHNLSKEITGAASRAGILFEDGDILVVAQKIVSKSEGRTARLTDVRPSSRAISLATKLAQDPRFVEIVLRESRRIVRSDRVLIVETHHGFVCANAGVDHSNVPRRDSVTLLPKDPDRSARRLAAELRKQTRKRLGLIISDTFGRPWRLGIANVAIGASRVPILIDLRGTRDSHRKLLRATVLAVADELAAAAGLLMGKSAGTPVVVIRGYRYPAVQATAASLIRPASEDLFR